MGEIRRVDLGFYASVNQPSLDIYVGQFLQLEELIAPQSVPTTFRQQLKTTSHLGFHHSATEAPNGIGHMRVK